MNPKSSKAVVIDYNGGNLASAQRALIYAAQTANLPVEVEISNDPQTIQQADHIILPGQGAFADCMAGLKAIPALLDSLQKKIRQGTPFLGICVGMQLMAEKGLEYSVTEGLGWVQGEISKLETTDLPLPHMGWNELDFQPGIHPILDGIEPGDHVYFVHSYALRHAAPEDIVATTQYGQSIPAIIARGNTIGTQFHVEKSQKTGLRILTNFLRWNPAATL